MHIFYVTRKLKRKQAILSHQYPIPSALIIISYIIIYKLEQIFINTHGRYSPRYYIITNNNSVINL